MPLYANIEARGHIPSDRERRERDDNLSNALTYVEKRRLYAIPHYRAGRGGIDREGIQLCQTFDFVC